ncbi:6671_t:CDS:2, partial [Entrophospora sp. SA101]
TELSALNSNLVSKNSELAHMENALISKDDELKRMKDDLALKTSEIYSLETKLSLETVKIGANTDKIPEVTSERSNLRRDSKTVTNGDDQNLELYDTLQNIEPMKNMNPEGIVTLQVAKQINVSGSPKNLWLMLILLIIIILLVRFIRPILNANSGVSTAKKK